MLSIFNALAALFRLLRDLLGWKQRAEDRQAGRDEVRAEVSAKTVETQNEMDGVARPTDDAVADSLRDGRF